jgi:FkbM family methyltransferase
MFVLKECLRPLYWWLKSKRYREFSRLMGKYGHLPRFQPRDVRFMGYRFRVPDLPSFLWQFKDIFVDELYRFRPGSENPVIYDCGANVGLSCLYFKLLSPGARIVAFEADPAIAQVLEENLRANSIGDVEIVAKAVHTREGSIQFGVHGADGGSVYLQGQKIEVEAVRLRDWLAQEEGVDFLKLDIEGSEVEVIPDCADVLGRVENLFVEYHSWGSLPQRLDELLKTLRLAGFRYYIQGLTERRAPFVHRAQGQPLDLQLNIFAYRG